MAKAKMVTRTILATQVEALMCNTDTGETEKVVCLVAGTFKDNKSLLKATKKAYENDEKVLIVSVRELTKLEKLYGMPETDFIALSQELPPRGKSE